MAMQTKGNVYLTKSVFPDVFPLPAYKMNVSMIRFHNNSINVQGLGVVNRRINVEHFKVRLVSALGGSASSNGTNSSSNSSDASKKKGVPNSNYVVPLDKSPSSSSSCITRPLNEILRDLNKRIPDNIIKPSDHSSSPTFITWYHANRMLSFYAPGWCGEIRDVIFSDNGSVTVVYRVTIRGSDGEAHRESTGTISPSDGNSVDPVAAAEEIAFCRACARFGLGLYLYHEE